jgi:antitoxin component of MazEF toxin-antitoxin module
MVKWGNSLAVRIPKPVVEEAMPKEGDSLEIEASEGRVELRRATKIRTLAQLVSQITAENRYVEIAAGAEVGKKVSGLAVVCPLTSKRNPYPFALPVTVDQVDGAVLVNQLKSMDWAGRKAKLHPKAESEFINKVRQYVAVLLGLR